MSKIVWDGTGTRKYETGVDRGVLYPAGSEGAYNKGVAWNGLVGVSEKPTGAEANPIYADNIKYGSLDSNEEFAATVEAFTYPDEFEECDGSKEIVPGVHVTQQTRKMFGLAYRNMIGNDVDGISHGYRIHLVWGCKAAPSERGHKTIGESPEAETMSWEVTTTPVAVAGYKPIAHMTIDSTTLDSVKLQALEKKLYGDETTEPTLPSPSEVITLVSGG